VSDTVDTRVYRFAVVGAGWRTLFYLRPDTTSVEAVEGHGRHPPPFIRDTNAIEALNRQLRKAIKTKGHFPNEEAAKKLIYLAITNAVPAWTRTRNWTTALLAFKIHFGDRLPE
jgi:transposase-like protein